MAIASEEDKKRHQQEMSKESEDIDRGGKKGEEKEALIAPTAPSSDEEKACSLGTPESIEMESPSQNSADNMC